MSLGKIIFSEQQVQAAITRYANYLNTKYINKKLVLIGVLNGAVFFCVNLAQQLKINVQIDFVAVSSYKGTKQNDHAQFYKNIKINLKNKHILVLEDIISTGKTLKMVETFILSQSPASLSFCSLLKLTDVSQVQLANTNTLFTVAAHGRWFVGCGLDLNEKYRNLPNIHVLKQNE